MPAMRCRSTRTGRFTKCRSGSRLAGVESTEPEVDVFRRLPALVFTDVPRGKLTRFTTETRAHYETAYGRELPRMRIVVTTHGAHPAQVAAAIHRRLG